MTFDQLWAGMIQRNPALANDQAKVTIAADKFRAALRQAFELGEKSANDKVESVKKQRPISSSMDDIFKSPFGI